MNLPSQFISLVGSGAVEAANIVGVSHLLKQKAGFATVVVLTRQATRFVTTDSLYHMGDVALVVSDDTPKLADVPNHVFLNRNSLGTAVYPACTDFIGKIANGIAPDLASTVVAGAFGKPLVVIPSTNAEMWQNPFLQKNISALAEAGVTFPSNANGLAPGVTEVVNLIIETIKPV